MITTVIEAALGKDSAATKHKLAPVMFIKWAEDTLRTHIAENSLRSNSKTRKTLDSLTKGKGDPGMMNKMGFTVAEIPTWAQIFAGPDLDMPRPEGEQFDPGAVPAPGEPEGIPLLDDVPAGVLTDARMVGDYEAMEPVATEPTFTTTPAPARWAFTTPVFAGAQGRPRPWDANVTTVDLVGQVGQQGPVGIQGPTGPTGAQG